MERDLVLEIEKHKYKIAEELGQGKDIKIKKSKDGIKVQALKVKVIK